MVKTTVMMIGEFEFDSIFFPEDCENALPYPVSTTILFVVFLVVMAIIIMNLLVGLAVDDIKAVQEQAVLKRLAMQVDLVLDVERLLPNFILRRYNVQKETIVRKHRRWWSVFTDVVSSRSIVKDVLGFRDVIELTDVSEKQETLQETVNAMRKELGKLAKENAKMKDILLAMAEKSSVGLAGDAEF